MRVAQSRPVKVTTVKPFTRELTTNSSSRRTRWLALYNIGIWTLLTIALFAQFFGVIWSSVQVELHSNFGREPTTGKFAITGQNDEPYSDRAVACVKRGREYRPVQLSQLLRTTNVTFKNSIEGYRVVTRDSFTMEASNFPYYVRYCFTLSRTLDSILSACSAVGYTVANDNLRIVDGIGSTEVVELRSTLPVLIIPYWDYGSLTRFVVPGKDGNACMFRGVGTLISETEPTVARLSAVPRVVREAKTEEWLQYRGGVWRNGWYEDPVTKMRWYSDVISSLPNGPYGIDLRQFDLFDGGKELDCKTPPYICRFATSSWRWNSDLQMLTRQKYYHSITISNGSRFGIFKFESLSTQVVTSRYSLDKLVSNMSLGVLLAHWFVLIIALYPVDTIGVGALSNCRSFYLMPVLLLPRLKSSLTGFWTAGCNFEGNQRALVVAWFEIYPAIGETIIVYFSLLNMLAKLLRLRASDVLFGPTLVIFGLMHYFRIELAATGWLGVDGRMTTLVTSNELEAASLFDFFTTDLAFRIGSKVKPIFFFKIAVLVANTFPLVLGSRRVRDSLHVAVELKVERSLAILFYSNGGLGSTRLPYTAKPAAARPYELARRGYVVVGVGSRRVLVTVDEWVWLLVAAAIQRAASVRMRVVVYDLRTTDSADKVLVLSATPRLVAIDHCGVEQLAVTRISAEAFQ